MFKISYSTKSDSSDQIGSFEAPRELLENKDIWDEVVSYNTWCKELTDSDRIHLRQFLPDLPEDEQSDNIKQLFTGKEYRFNTNPCTVAFYQLQGLLPQYTGIMQDLATARHTNRNQIMTSHYNSIISDIIASRKRYFSGGDMYEQEKKRLQKAQRELNRSEKLTLDTDPVKKETLKYLQQLPLPPLPEMTQIDARVQEIIDRVGYVKSSNRREVKG